MFQKYLYILLYQYAGAKRPQGNYAEGRAPSSPHIPAPRDSYCIYPQDLFYARIKPSSLIFRYCTPLRPSECVCCCFLGTFPRRQRASPPSLPTPLSGNIYPRFDMVIAMESFEPIRDTFVLGTEKLEAHRTLVTTELDAFRSVVSEVLAEASNLKVQERSLKSRYTKLNNHYEQVCRHLTHPLHIHSRLGSGLFGGLCGGCGCLHPAFPPDIPHCLQYNSSNMHIHAVNYHINVLIIVQCQQVMDYRL